MRRWATVLATLALILTGTGAVPAVAAAPQTSACATDWGSNTKAAPGPITSVGALTDVRTGRHACYDRIVFDIPGMTTAEPAAYWVQYSGSTPVEGGEIIGIDFTAPVNHTQYPVELYDPLPGLDFNGYQTFRNATFDGYYYGATHIGLGVRAMLPFRVLVLPERLVVDVAHRW